MIIVTYVAVTYVAVTYVVVTCKHKYRGLQLGSRVVFLAPTVNVKPIYWAFKLMTGKEGMGYGDFKLLAAIGAWLGWQALPAVALLAAAAGLLYALTAILLGRRSRRQPIPFGPFLAAAGCAALIWREQTTALLGA